MTVQFKGYAVRSGDLWWSQRQHSFMDTPDESSFTPTKYGSTVLRISRRIKQLTKEIEFHKSFYTDEYIKSNRNLTRAGVDAGLTRTQKKLDLWQNARVVETTLNVTEV